MSNPFQKNDKKFSLLVPIYKETYKTLNKFFFALLNQEYKEFEVLIAFDGENPSGVRHLKKLIKGYPELNIKYDVFEWGGACSARNHAYEMSSGDYILALDPDSYLYPESLRIWANEFEANPEIDVVWGFYEVMAGNDKMTVPFGGFVPCDQAGNFDYWAVRSTNYITGSSPVRRSAYLGWDTTVKSLQDWDMWLRMLIKDNFSGKNFKFMPRPFFLTEPIRDDGISADSANNWIERREYVLKKNGLKINDLVVTSIGAPLHALHVSRTLDCDYLPYPQFKPHKYKRIYLLGFYPEGASSHAQVFEGASKDCKKIVHWIGTDVFNLLWKVPFKPIEFLKSQFKKDGYIMLSEYKATHDELKELDIDSKIVPIPPKSINTPIPLPEEFAVAVYENTGQATPDLVAQKRLHYYLDKVESIVTKMPDVKFYFFGDESRKGEKGENYEHLGWIDIEEWMPKFSCNLRLTMHDGLPLTPMQFITAGRNVITNAPLEHTIKVGEVKNGVWAVDEKEVIEAIRKCRKLGLNEKGAKYWSLKLDKKKFNKVIRGL